VEKGELVVGGTSTMLEVLAFVGKGLRRVVCG